MSETSTPASRSVQALRDFLATPEGKASIAEFAAKRIAEDEARRAYFGSEAFSITYDKLIGLTVDDDCVQTDDYGDPDETITNDELLEFSYSLDKRVADGHDGVEVVQELPPCPFSTQTLKYKDLIVQTTCGQGCFTRVSRATDTNHMPYPYNAEEVGVPDWED